MVFLFGAPLALELGCGLCACFVSQEKLPREVISESYALEYGEDTLEIHVDAIVEGDKVLMVGRFTRNWRYD